MKTRHSRLLSALAVLLLSIATAFAQDPPRETSGVKIGQGFADYIRPIIGAGFVIRQDDHVDFKVENDFLLTNDDSRFRVGALAGFFTPVSACGVWWHKIEMARGDGRTEQEINSMFNQKALDCRTEVESSETSALKKFFVRSGIIYTLQFTQGSQDTVDGFTFGWGYELKPGVLLTFGHTRNKGEELSIGFQRAAALAIRDTSQTQFANFRDLVNDDNSGLKSLKDWDGLPLKLNNGAAVFPGNPIVESFNSSWSFGVAISVDAILK